ncbi:hypothetical protein GHT06_016676 [Daphnia sinensis]|uniref:BHLH domain-containing protein n=1 Tax=Daphnia sinensis TaxID=1820382 RepID=A0AAD5L6Y5_9CRUS|nr:hypothetical protein GHT06_016676 [Daphnia sinensis]
MNRKRDSCSIEGNRFETRGSENRKVRKPMMEKKRRARINQSLNDLKRLLMETDNVKKEGSRPSKLEKADVLELTVNYVQKLHKERLALRNGLSEHGFSDTCSSPSADSSNFKAGFKECARVVREVLRHQQQQTVEENLYKRIGWHLENFLANIEADQVHRKSPALSLGSDSCSSFEEKDMLLSSPEFLPHRSSPVNHALCSSSAASEESQDSCHRRSFTNKTNCFEFTSTPNSSPVSVFRTDIASSRWTCGFKSIPHGTPDMADNWNQRTNSQLTRHRIMPYPLPSESIGNANDALNTDVLTCGLLATSTSSPVSSSSSLAPSPTQNHYAPQIMLRPGVSPYDDRNMSLPFSKPEAEKSRVWRPW